MRRFTSMLCAAAIALAACTANAASRKEPALSIGSYTSGCLKNSEIIEDGEGYQLMRTLRHRNFGHPAMIQFIKAYARKLKKESGGVLLVGDIGQRKGGPMEYGHSSHQVGLDADFWFWFPDKAMQRRLTESERETIGAVSLVTPTGSLDTALWSHRYPQMLRIASGFPQVERIFVNPAIKRQLCMRYMGEEWLHKIRPWWGHDEHFHVRLYCQKDSPDCKAQAPLPPGDGCDTSLLWWFGKEARLPATKADAQRYIKRFDALPKVCKVYLKQK